MNSLLMELMMINIYIYMTDIEAAVAMLGLQLQSCTI